MTVAKYITINRSGMCTYLRYYNSTVNIRSTQKNPTAFSHTQTIKIFFKNGYIQ